MSDREKRLEEALQSIWQYGADTLSGPVDVPDDRDWQREAVAEMTKRAREALADDATGVGECPTCNGSGLLDGYDPDNPPAPGCAEPCPDCDPDSTPPQHRDALEAAKRMSVWATHGIGSTNDDAVRKKTMYECLNRDFDIVRRHLTAPPTVPEAVRRLPEEWRRRSDPSGIAGAQRRQDAAVLERAIAPPTVPESIRGLPEALRSKARVARSHADNLDGMDAEHAVCASRADAHDEDADELEAALAQHSEPGRIPEGWKLTRHDEWISIGSPDGRVVQIWKGPDMISDVIYRMLEAMLAAPAPDADEREDG